MAKKHTPKPSPQPPADLIPAGYAELLEDLKGRVRAAQVRAALAVSEGLTRLYWHIGRAIRERQEREGWGQKVIDRLGDDLQRAFPGLSGFSRSNVYRMRAFHQAYAAAGIVPQAVGHSDPDGIPAPLLDIPWGHNALIVEKVEGTEARLWYAARAAEQGWSRGVLALQIESAAHRRQGRALTNFAATLPAPQSDLAGEVLKDPYCFEFLTLTDRAREAELQRGLLDHLRDLLIELGVGFAFVGSRYHLEVGGKDYYLDLLFYHLRLRSYVVIELKVTEFEPEFAGKLNFYLSAVDDLLRHPDDRASIGLILCPVKNGVVVEYALRDTSKPIGVAGYTTGRPLPPELRDALPSPDRLGHELEERTKRSPGPEPAADRPAGGRKKRPPG